MTRRRLEKNLIRKITKVGGSSYAVVLPIDVMRRWKWKERQKVVIEINDKKREMKIKDWKKKLDTGPEKDYNRN